MVAVGTFVLPENASGVVESEVAMRMRIPQNPFISRPQLQLQTANLKQ